jgi:hypothetical protein
MLIRSPLSVAAEWRYVGLDRRHPFVDLFDLALIPPATPTTFRA